MIRLGILGRMDLKLKPVRTEIGFTRDAMVGGDYDASLQNLKAAVEKNDPFSPRAGQPTVAGAYH